ncbi:MAG: ABC transporter substrate-binding protein [Gammaproteobacteria bacterium]|jgi:phospholipid transport system substrate-binding protein
MKWRMMGVIAVTVLALLESAPTWAIQSPEDLVRQTAEQMLSKLREDRKVIDAHPERIYELVDQIVLPHFDFERMSSWVLGKYWRRATPKQRKEFVEQFRTLLVRTYAKSLSSYTDNKITYLPFRGGPSKTDVKVRTEVDQPGGFPIPIDYDLYLKGDEWKVYDVTIDGVSLVTNYRTTFANQIRQKGLDRLIASLASRNKQAGAD